jgi:hypothetical protein
MTEAFTQLWPIVWPLVFAAGVLWHLGKYAKARAPKRWKGFHRTLPLHPLIAAVVFGLMPWSPVPETVAALGSGAKALYYAGAGLLAVYWQDLWRTWKKHSESGSSSGASD